MIRSRFRHDSESQGRSGLAGTSPKTSLYKVSHVIFSQQPNSANPEIRTPLTGCSSDGLQHLHDQVPVVVRGDAGAGGDERGGERQLEQAGLATCRPDKIKTCLGLNSR